MKLYKIFQALSLDIVIGVNLFTLAIGKYFQVNISSRILVGLSIAMWLIYTGDHLLDASKIKNQASTYRHQFHKKYFKPILFFASIAFVVGVWNAFYLPFIILLCGTSLGILTFIYFLLLHKKILWAKEISVAIICSTGILLAPVAFAYQNLTVVKWVLLFQVFFLVFSNLLIFAWFDYQNDLKDGHASMIQHWGIRRSELVIGLVLIMGMISCCVVLFCNESYLANDIQIMFFMMYFLLAFIFKFDRIFRKNDLYRVIGDGIFYLPLLFLIYA